MIALGYTTIESNGRQMCIPELSTVIKYFIPKGKNDLDFKAATLIIY